MTSSGRLRTYQVLVFIISGMAALVTSVSVGWTVKILNGECVLYSDMHLQTDTNGSLNLVYEKSDWGSDIDCNFATFCPVGVTIYCVIWIWFYIFLSDWGTSLIEDKVEKDLQSDRPPPDSHLLRPSIVCNIVVLGLVLATVAVVEAGRSEWCENIQDTLKKDCDYTAQVSWKNVQKGNHIYKYLSHGRIAGWVLLLSMVVQTALIFVRLRKSTRRPHPDMEASFTSGMSEQPYSEMSVADDDTDDVIPRSRRRIQRQKKVVVIDVEWDEGEEQEVGGEGTTLLGSHTANT